MSIRVVSDQEIDTKLSSDLAKLYIGAFNDEPAHVYLYNAPYRGDMDDEHYRRLHAFKTRELHLRLMDKHTRAWVAKADGQIVGFILYRVANECSFNVDKRFLLGLKYSAQNAFTFAGHSRIFNKKHTYQYFKRTSVLTEDSNGIRMLILAVDSHYRRRGIGRQLVNQSLSDLRPASGPFSCTLLASEEGKRLYQKVGFTVMDNLHISYDLTIYSMIRTELPWSIKRTGAVPSD
jgi:ribosomal protein S18 acetylase RimI-like enzyme